MRWIASHLVGAPEVTGSLNFILCDLVIPSLPTWRDLTHCTNFFKLLKYSKTCLKQPLKNRQNKGLNGKW